MYTVEVVKRYFYFSFLIFIVSIILTFVLGILEDEPISIGEFLMIGGGIGIFGSVFMPLSAIFFKNENIRPDGL